MGWKAAQRAACAGSLHVLAVPCSAYLHRRVFLDAMQVFQCEMLEKMITAFKKEVKMKDKAMGTTDKVRATVLVVLVVLW